MIPSSTEKIPQVVSLNISDGGIPKRPLSSVRVTFAGIDGDGHNHAKHARPEQAVSLQDVEQLLELRREGFPLGWGTTGENIDVVDMNINALPVGALLNFSGGVQLEITKVRQPCYVLDAIHPQLKEVLVNRCGMYARVRKEGRITVGERIAVVMPSASSLRNLCAVNK